MRYVLEETKTKNRKFDPITLRTNAHAQYEACLGLVWVLIVVSLSLSSYLCHADIRHVIHNQFLFAKVFL